MSRLEPPLLALLIAATGQAGAAEPPSPAPTSAPEEMAAPGPAPSQVFAGELVLVGGVSSLADLKLTGWEVRLGLGGRRGSAATSAQHLAAFDSATWLITAGISRSWTPAGLEVNGLRLGIGVRLQGGRFTLGGDVGWVQVEIPRVSTSGRLLARGAGVSLLGAFDLFRFGDGRAVMACVEGTLDSYGQPFDTGTHNTQFGLNAGIALRW